MEKADVINFLNDVECMTEDTTAGLVRIKCMMKHLRSFVAFDEEEKEININDCLEAVLSVIAYDIRKCGGITTSFGDVIPIKGNPAEINHVFLNVILNCLYRIKQNGSLSLSTRSDDVFSVVEIQFIGNTFSVDELNSTVFSSIAGTISDFTKPFGLFFARAIIKKYSGSITLETSSSHGSTILIRIPSISGEI